MRTVRTGLVILALSLGGVPSATAQAAEIPAYGSITISDEGFGARAKWTYDGINIGCESTTNGPGGVPQIVTVRCRPAEGGGLTFACPRMVVTRTTGTVVGARASCDSTLDMGIGTSGTATADLGPLRFFLTCEAYMDSGVLVPPYSVTCAEPGLPTLDASLASTAVI